MFKCKECGAEFVGDSLSKGVKVRCPNCRAVCEEVQNSSSYVCKECGLICDQDDEKCPACGGVVVKGRGDTSDAERSPAVPDVKATDSGKKKISEILGGYTYVILVGIWSCIIVPVAMIAMRGISNYNPVVIYPMIVMAVYAGFLLSQYYTDNIRFLKWMFYYCVLGCVLNIGGTLYAISVSGGDVRPSGGVAVWVLLAWIFKKYRKL